MGLLDNAQQGAPMVPDMAQAAASAGAPAPGAGQPPPGAPAGGPQPPGAGPPQGGPPQGGPPQGGPPQQAVRQVDPGATAVAGQLPKGMSEEQADPEEQKEYERAMQALSKILYSSDEIANSIVDQIQPEDKVGSTAKVSMLLISQLDQKINMDESVVAAISTETVERITELAEARHNSTYGERELQVIMGSVWEGVQEMFGMEQQDAEALMSGVGEENLAQLQGQYEGFLNG
jgi:hypothetical protein